jgi:multiple sugar transport system substrate-binding protein/raffinose/stachyose/melibiose transport system substrate-binding protein
LFSYWAGAKTQSLVDRGSVQPLGSLFGGAVPTDSFEPAVYQAMVYNGQPYMVPITRHFVGFFYNARLFKAAGLKVPRTWDQFLAVCATFKARGVTPLALGAKNRWPAQFWFDYLLLRTAGFQWRQDLMAGKHSYADPAVREAFTRWRALADAGWFNADAASIDWDAAALRVTQGSCAMTLNGTWLVGTFAEKGYVYPRDYGFFAFPSLGLDAENSALGPIDGILLSSGAAHKAAALKALALLAGAEPQLAFSQAAGSIPAVAGVPADRLQPLQRQIKGIIDASTHWAFNFDLATSPERSEIGLNELLAFVAKPAGLDAILADWDKKLDALAAK